MGEHEKTFEFLSMKMEDDDLDTEANEDLVLTGDIVFDNVSFTYPGSNKEILKGMSFRISPGEFVGIVGPSGVGKSTVFDLLLKFYEPSAGSILIDGVDIEHIPSGVLRRNISVVSQDTFLFSGTLRENLQIVKPDATKDELFEAMRLANFLPVMDSLPDGLDTELGENGARLSGGEKQRLALASASARH